MFKEFQLLGRGSLQKFNCEGYGMNWLIYKSHYGVQDVLNSIVGGGGY